MKKSLIIILFLSLTNSFSQSVDDINLIDKIKIKSALLRNDFRMKKSFFLKKFQEEFGTDQFMDVYVL